MVLNWFNITRERSRILKMPSSVTRGKLEKKREMDRKRYQVKRNDPAQRKKVRIRSFETRKRKRTENQLLNDEIVYWKEMAYKWQRKAKKLEEQLLDAEEKNHVKDEEAEFQPPSDIDEASNAESSEEIEPEETPNIYEKVQQHLQLRLHVHHMTRLDQSAFDRLVAEVKPTFEATTWRGTPRKRKRKEKQPFSIEIGVFITLFWMAHYPTLRLMSSLFDLPTLVLTRIMKRTTRAMAIALRSDIKWPTDDELEAQTYSFLQNDGFYDLVCVVDGTEIKISRPANPELQRKTWSGKKKQNSLNVMFITNLHGEIMYYSPMRVGAHDQAHWNELGLRDLFLNKEYAIGGDGGFTFNRKKDTVAIRAYKPHKKAKGGCLSIEQKEWNRRFSQMRVVVETSICRVKSWKILRGVYRHWRGGNGQIDANDVLTIAVVLSNREIRSSPPRPYHWVAPDWQVVLAPTCAPGPDPN